MRYGKSKQANGTVIIPGVDGRSGWVRRAKELISEHTSGFGRHRQHIGSREKSSSVAARRSALSWRVLNRSSQWLMKQTLTKLRPMRGSPPICVDC